MFPNAEIFLQLYELETALVKLVNSKKEDLKYFQDKTADYYFAELGKTFGLQIALNVLTEKMENNDRQIWQRKGK